MHQQMKTTIHWYPGHMEKAKREMLEKLKACDIVIEIRDARIPEASSNPMLNSMIQNKPRLIILSKVDLADPEITKKWIQFYTKEQQIAVALDLVNDKNSKQIIIDTCYQLTKEKREKMKARGIKPRPMRAMVCGIPNVGKSTFINCVYGKNKTVTADKPGVTRTLTWIHADKTLDILDTPGLLWPKFEDQLVGVLLAILGSINQDIVAMNLLAQDLITILKSLNIDVMGEYESTITKEPLNILEDIAKARHLLKTNQTYDIERASEVLIYDLRKGKLGKISLQVPYEENQAV